jgi:two-component system, chemotaxis family, chemotaxis protein CheY
MMILIDENAEELLFKTLTLKKKAWSQHKFCYMRFPLPLNTKNITREILPIIEQTILSQDKMFFVFGDGDAVLICPDITHKDLKHLTLNITKYLGCKSEDARDWIEEIAYNWKTVFDFAELKYNKIVRLRNAIVSQQASSLAARQQDEVLQFPLGPEQVANVHAIRSARRGLSILLVEDDKFLQRLAKNVLQPVADVTIVDHGWAAMTHYLTVAPDIIFLDINLPDVSGHDLLQKWIAADPSVHVIMLSGNADKPNVLHSMKHGAKGFVVKPFTKEKVLQYVDAYCQQHKKIITPKG